VSTVLLGQTVRYCIEYKGKKDDLGFGKGDLKPTIHYKVRELFIKTTPDSKNKALSSTYKINTNNHLVILLEWGNTTSHLFWNKIRGLFASFTLKKECQMTWGLE
jgi:hypothetical protein